MIELSLVVAIITGVGQIFKKVVPAKYMPIVSLLLGIGSGFVFVDGSLAIQLLNGVGLGLAANGLFEVSKLPTKIKK
jgi:hypothetical protein